MKNLYSLFVVLFLTTVINAQTDAISYQAVILNPKTQELPGFDAESNILPNTNISMRFTIINNNGSIDYQETQQPRTDNYGLVNLFIGKGLPVSAQSFYDIKWDGKPKTLKVEIDFNAGNQYTDLGEQILTFVPFAYHRNIYASEDLIVEGETELKNNLIVGGITTFEGDLQINGEMQIDGPLQINNVVNFDNGITVNGTTQLNDHLNVLGETNINNTLTVTGDTELQKDLHIIGNTLLDNSLIVAGQTDINASINILDNTNIGKNLLVSGITTLQNTLNANGESHLNDKLIVSGNTKLLAQLEVNENTQLNNNLNVNGATNLNNFLEVTGNTSLLGQLNVAESTQLENTLKVAGEATFYDKLNINGDLLLNNQLHVIGNTSLDGNLLVKGESDFENKVTIFGVTKLNNELKVSGNTNLEKSLSVGEETYLNNSLDVLGTSFLHNNLDVQEDTNLEGTMTVAGITTLNNALNVSGNTNINNKLKVLDDTEIDGKLAVLGETTIANNMQVDGVTTLNNTLNVMGTTNINEALNVTGVMWLKNDLTVDGASLLNNKLQVIGETSLDNSLSVNGETTLHENLNVEDETFLNNKLNVLGETNLENSLIVNGDSQLDAALNVIGETTLENNLVVSGVSHFENDIQIVSENPSHIAVFENTFNGNGDGIKIQLGKNHGAWDSNHYLHLDNTVADILTEPIETVQGWFSGSDSVSPDDILNMIPSQAMAGSMARISNSIIENINEGLNLPLEVVPKVTVFPGYEHVIPNIDIAGFDYWLFGTHSWGGFELVLPDIDILEEEIGPYVLPAIPEINTNEMSELNFPNFNFSNVSNTLDKDNEYITFTDKDGRKTGSIRAQSVDDWKDRTVLDGLYLLNVAVNFIQIDQMQAWMKGFAYVSNLTEDFNSLGVEYSSGNGDYAEWLEREELAEYLSSGDIVGVKGGKITKDLTNAEQVMVVSHKPIVLGNMPEQADFYKGNTVAFMGQVPVKVMGRVHSGDYIVAHPEISGYGKAVKPEEMKIEDYKMAVGRAWNTNETEGPKLVNTVIGVHNGKWMNILKDFEKKHKDSNERLNQLEMELMQLKEIINNLNSSNE